MIQEPSKSCCYKKSYDGPFHYNVIHECLILSNLTHFGKLAIWTYHPFENEGFRCWPPSASNFYLKRIQVITYFLNSLDKQQLLRSVQQLGTLSICELGRLNNSFNHYSKVNMKAQLLLISSLGLNQIERERCHSVSVNCNQNNMLTQNIYSRATKKNQSSYSTANSGSPFSMASWVITAMTRKMYLPTVSCAC